MAATLVHRGLLSIAFGVATFAGFSGTPAQAHGPHGHGAPDTSHDTVPDTRATQRNASVFLAHYAARMENGTRLGIIDHDRMEAFNSAPETSDVNTVLLSDGAQLDGDSMDYIAGKLEEKSSRGVYSINNSAALHLHHDTQEAFAQPLLTSSDGAMMCVTVLGNPGIAVATIDGLSQDQVIRFVNRHELRHCTDTSGLQDLAGLYTRWQQLEAGDVGSAETETARYAYQAQMLYRESIADLGGLADMIVFDKDSPDIIAKVAQWRQNEVFENDDVAHYTTSSLQALADKIAEIGVETFRAMPEAAREKMLYDIAAHNHLSAGSFAYLAGHLTGVNDTPLRPKVDVSEADHAAVTPWIAQLDAHEYSATPEQTQIILNDAQLQELRDWNVRARLTEGAMSRGSMSRDNLHRARVGMLDAIRTDLAATPDNPLHGARLVLLENTFKTMMHELDAPAPQKVQVTAQARPAGPG